MKNEKAGSPGGFKEQLENLSERERLLLKAMLGVLTILALVVVVFFSQRAVAALEAETRLYSNALSLMATAGPAYQEAQQGGNVDPRVAKFSDEVLNEGRVQLTGFVATHAGATGVAVSSYNEQQNALGTERRGDAGPRIIERALQIDIRSAEMDRLVEFLHRIEESTDPVVIRRVRIHTGRSDGEVRQVQVVISTFERRGTEES